MGKNLKAFTLIETLVAIAILTVTLGAAVVTTRTLQINTRITTEQTEMQSISREVVANFRLLRNGANANGKHLYDVLGLPSVPTSQSVQGTLYLSDPTVGTISWCSFSLTGACKGMKPWVTLHGDTTFDAVQTELGGGLLVAVARKTATNLTNSLQMLQIVDSLSTVSGSPPSIDISAINRWTFYVCTVSIQRYAPSDTALSFASDEGRVTTTASNLRSGVYQVTISIRNYYDPQSRYTITSELTDSL